MAKPPLRPPTWWYLPRLEDISHRLFADFGYYDESEADAMWFHARAQNPGQPQQIQWTTESMLIWEHYGFETTVPCPPPIRPNDRVYEAMVDEWSVNHHPIVLQWDDGRGSHFPDAPANGRGRRTSAGGASSHNKANAKGGNRGSAGGASSHNKANVKGGNGESAGGASVQNNKANVQSGNGGSAGGVFDMAARKAQLVQESKDARAANESRKKQKAESATTVSNSGSRAGSSVKNPTGYAAAAALQPESTTTSSPTSSSTGATGNDAGGSSGKASANWCPSGHRRPVVDSSTPGVIPWSAVCFAPNARLAFIGENGRNMKLIRDTWHVAIGIQPHGKGHIAYVAMQLGIKQSDYFKTVLGRLAKVIQAWVLRRDPNNPDLAVDFGEFYVGHVQHASLADAPTKADFEKYSRREEDSKDKPADSGDQAD